MPGAQRRGPPAAFAEPAVRAALAAAARGPSLLALDYDGTLAPFRAERGEARAPDAVLAPLRRIAACPEARLAVVSGRPVADLERLLDLDPLPELHGAHGWERRRPDGTREDRALPEEAARALDGESARLEAAGNGARVERKRAGLALHWRGLGADEASALEARVAPRWRAFAARHGFALRPFDGGIELRRPGRDKGDAMRDLLAETPAGAAVAYLGDDETDEDAFRALEGRGLALLAAGAPRPTAADAAIAPAEVAAFLECWADACAEAARSEAARA